MSRTCSRLTGADKEVILPSLKACQREFDRSHFRADLHQGDILVKDADKHRGKALGWGRDLRNRIGRFLAAGQAEL